MTVRLSVARRLLPGRAKLFRPGQPKPGNRSATTSVLVAGGGQLVGQASLADHRRPADRRQQRLASSWRSRASSWVRPTNRPAVT